VRAKYGSSIWPWTSLTDEREHSVEDSQDALPFLPHLGEDLRLPQ
jgi:hypothetical protein